jgi:hypothetical protein
MTSMTKEQGNIQQKKGNIQQKKLLKMLRG